MTQTDRIVHCEDALSWLEREVLLDCSMIASIPDFSEFPTLNLMQWKQWFTQTARLIMDKCPENGVSIFYQSDIKVDGVWVDKAYLVMKAAEDLGQELLWHKIMCRAPAGVITFGRPAYSHMLCFAKKLRADVSLSTADVIPDIGDKVWERGMGLEACLMAGRFILKETPSKKIVNPFCGHGSMLAVANVLGLEAVGIERSPKRAQKARLLEVNSDFKSWKQ